MEQNNINKTSMLRMGHVLRGIYRIESYLSSGGFGNTYVATDLDFEEKCAIKEFFMKGVNVRAANNTTVSVGVTENQQVFKEQLQKFKKEAKRMRQLKNPHIVNVHALFEENGTAYYVMDFIDGENLSKQLKRLQRPLAENVVMNDYLPQILDALECVHKEGLWHLDLKPANIMIDKKGHISLIDFGASKQQSNKGGATKSAVSYTNGFAPREQMEQNQEKFGPWTDLYALGATLYNLLSNKLPPMPSDIDDDTTPDKHFMLPLPENVSEKARSLILRLMATHWSKRPKSVKEVLQLMEQLQLKSVHTEKALLNDDDYITILDTKDKPSEEQAEKERIAREKAEQERIAREKAEKERIAKEKAEKERIAKEKAEKERIAKEKAEKERIAKEKAEKERIAREQAEKERIAKEKAEKERIAKEKAEKERIAKEKAEKERLEKERLERERIAKEKAEKERIAKEQAEKERIAKEKAEKKRLEKERLERERIAKEKAEKERIAKEKAEKERIAKEKAEQERIAKEQAEKERIAKEKAEKERLEKEKEDTIIIPKEDTTKDNTGKSEKEKEIYPEPPAKWRMALIAGGIVAAIGIAVALLLPSKKESIDEFEKEQIWTEIMNNGSDTISTQENEQDTESSIVQEEEETQKEELVQKQKEEQAKKQQEELAKKQKEEQEKKQKEELAKKQKEEQQRKQKEEQERKKKEEELNRQCLSYYNNANSAYNSRNLKGAWSNINSIERLSSSYARRSDVQSLKKKIQDTALEIKNITGKDPRFQ